METDVAVGADGLARCRWGAEPEIYRDYHDREWGRPLRGDDALFERISLEAFQAGLSWLTILKRRESFRAAFDGFRIDKVAAYGEADVERLLADAGIIRNRQKVVATVANAEAARDLDGGLTDLVWSFAPEGRPRPAGITDVPAVTEESKALARELKRHGFRFVGPTTAYAMMQAIGMVDDHVPGCHVAEGSGTAAR